MSSLYLNVPFTNHFSTWSIACLLLPRFSDRRYLEAAPVCSDTRNFQNHGLHTNIFELCGFQTTIFIRFLLLLATVFFWEQTTILGETVYNTALLRREPGGKSGLLQGKISMAQLQQCIGLYKPRIKLPGLGTVSHVNLFHCYFFSQVLQVVTWIDSQNWRLWIRAEIQDHPPKKSRSNAAPLKMNGRNLKNITLHWRSTSSSESSMFKGSKFCSEVQQGISFGFPSFSMFRLRNAPKHLRNIICYNSVIGAIEGAVTWKCHSRCCMPSVWAHLRLALFPWLLWV